MQRRISFIFLHFFDVALYIFVYFSQAYDIVDRVPFERTVELCRLDVVFFCYLIVVMRIDLGIVGGGFNWHAAS